MNFILEFHMIAIWVLHISKYNVTVWSEIYVVVFVCLLLHFMLFVALHIDVKCCFSFINTHVCFAFMSLFLLNFTSSRIASFSIRFYVDYGSLGERNALWQIFDWQDQCSMSETITISSSLIYFVRSVHLTLICWDRAYSSLLLKIMMIITS